MFRSVRERARPDLPCSVGVSGDDLAPRDAVRQRMTALPAGRVAKPHEIADMMAFLASDRSAYTSGVIVTIDGGFCAAG